MKRPLPFFAKFSQKAVISGLIRLTFEANQENTQYVSAPQWTEEENEEQVEGLSFIPGAVSEPRRARRSHIVVPAMHFGDVQLVVRLEEQGLGHTRQHGPPTCQSVSQAFG